MKFYFRLFFTIFTIFGLFFALFSQSISPVHAATCIWTGLINNNWAEAANWNDCGGGIPGAADDVTIPNTIVSPTIYEYAGASVNQLIIESGGQLTVSGYNILNAALLEIHGTLFLSMSTDDQVVVNNSYSGTVNNYGTVQATGVNAVINTLEIMSTFNNSGNVILQNASLILDKGGTHTGTFDGNTGTYIFLGGSTIQNQIHDFNATSYMKVPNFFVRDGIVNFYGTYWPSVTDGNLTIQPLSASCELIFKPESTIVSMPDITSLSLAGKLTFESPFTDLILNRLDLGPLAEINNAGNLEILNTFNWTGGKLSGIGITEVANGTSFTIRSGSHYLDQQQMITAAIANWNGGNITLSNDASFQNDSTFYANATTTMGGGSNGTFVNNGFLVKKNDPTVTTLDIAFTNTGAVDVQAGELIFISSFSAGSGTIIDLGDGTLTTGETLTLEAGSSLVGSGTLNSNLVNGGEVSPGSSPGLISVDGNFEQTEQGFLSIELGGTSAGSEYDQVAITGEANLAGTLDVTLLGEYRPSVGDSFTILTYGSRTGTFTTINLPVPPPDAGMEWEFEYESNALILTTVSTFSYLFLPMIIR